MLGELVLCHPLYAPIFMLITGLILAFHGRKTIPLAIGLCAMALGYLYGGLFLASVSSDPVLLRWAPFAIAVLFTVLVLFLYRLAFFFAGVLIGLFLAGFLLPEASWMIIGLAALGTGAIVYVSRNFVFSVLTAVLGGALTATGAVNLSAWAGVYAGPIAYWFLFAAISLFGVFYQLKHGGK